LSVLVHFSIILMVAVFPPKAADLGAETVATVLVFPTAMGESQSPRLPMEPATEDDPTAKKDPEPSFVTPGVDDSMAEVETWKGVREADATEHAAPKGEVEQAGWTPEPVASDESFPNDDLSREEETVLSARGEETPVLPQRARVAVEAFPPVEQAAPRPSPRPEPSETGILPSGESLQHDGALGPPELRAMVALRSVNTGDEPKTISTPQTAPPSTDAGLGLKADDESDARSLEEPLVVRLGEPVARKGLRIRTSYARFSTSTLLLARPRSAMVRVTFGRNGKVVRAEFVPGQTTGYEEVDKPLLDSLHRWTASGKDLLQIPVDNPDAGVTITFRIIFDGKVRG
jgi:hypothetical protein